ncbi:uncharacterized protein LOC108853472 [Raphanus sativus]|uniref:Uncharacterized protein LOC108853472 n=1 Tax=Raphanus sativus TaxID=3726 RepID=A0A6J0NCC0_RAPSA|nr:uncharacterized protein LOC108853472 [Raphanus sativus]
MLILSSSSPSSSSSFETEMAFRPSRLLQTSSMAAAPHTFLSFSSPPRLLTSPSSTFPRSSFGGVSLNLHHRQSVKTNNPVKNIHNMVMSLNFSAIEVKTINSVESWEDGVLVAVSGSVKTKEFSNMCG